MLTQDEAERRVKGLQKEFLLRIEAHPLLHDLDHESFNDLRKRVFRGTFQAYRLGVVGLDGKEALLYSLFFGWLESNTGVQRLDPTARIEITAMCFRAALESFRIGGMIAIQRDDSPYVS